MRMVTASGRSRWPLVIIGAVVVVALGGGIAYSVIGRDAEPVAVPSSAAPSPTSSPSATGGSSGAGDEEDGVAPTGCLGGQDRNVNMVLTAQAEAKQTAFGAVEVATSFYRWLWQYPNPSPTDADAVSAGVIASTANESFKDLAGSYQGVSDMTAGEVPAATPFHLSSTNGLWLVSEASTSDRVEVNLAEGYVIDGELSPSKSAVIALTMVWEDGGWHVESGGTPDQAKLANGGTRYTGGC